MKTLLQAEHSGVNAQAIHAYKGYFPKSTSSVHFTETLHNGHGTKVGPSSWETRSLLPSELHLPAAKHCLEFFLGAGPGHSHTQGREGVMQLL